MAMRTIWKYPLQPSSHFSLDLPKGAEFLHVADQRGAPAMWFRVDSEAETERQHFAVVGTGHPTPDDAEGDVWWHLGSFAMEGGSLMWHLFWRDFLAD
jgi:hypothetical protein